MQKNKNFKIKFIVILSAILFFGLIAAWSGLELTKLNINNQNNYMKEIIVREPAVAGKFYPADKGILKKQINSYLLKAPSQEFGKPKILIVPHAGIDYSGQTAAFAYKQLKPGDFEKVIILGPSHNFPVLGVFGSGVNAWETPLGDIKIWKLDEIKTGEDFHGPEHSIEVQLPFLKQTLKDNFKVAPLIVGNLSEVQIDEFVSLLKEKILDNQTLIIVSVDLSHYHSYDEAMQLDHQSIDTILNLDRQGVDSLEIDSPASIKAAIQLAKDLSLAPKLFDYKNSGDITGDKSRVVGYAAFGFYQEANQQEQDDYSRSEKQELLSVARATLDNYFKGGEVWQPPKGQINEKFLEKRGVFVTLKKAEQLRGCIGYLESVKPLIEAIQDNVMSAALRDSRFIPVSVDELADIKIEISILTLPEKTELRKIEMYKDGVILKQGNKSATYLPQVWEDLPDQEQFFSSLCKKAGLDSNCWQDKDTEFYKYQAIVFGEK